MDSDKLKIFQWNSHSIKNKIHNLRDTIDDYDIVTLSETWLKENSLLRIPNYHILRKDRLIDQHGGVAIIIKKNIPFQEDNTIYHKEKSIETLAISIPLATNNNNKQNSLLIVTIYRIPSTSHTTPHEWNSLLSTTKKYKYVLIGGDFNAHHPSWGSNKICKTGENLIETLVDYNLNIINDGTHTYHYHRPDSHNASTNSTPQLQSSAIDLTIVSTNLQDKTSWSVRPDKMNSDHHPIECTIYLNHEKIPFNSTHKLNHNYVDWKKYTMTIEKYIEDNKNVIDN